MSNKSQYHQVDGLWKACRPLKTGQCGITGAPHAKMSASEATEFNTEYELTQAAENNSTLTTLQAGVDNDEEKVFDTSEVAYADLEQRPHDFKETWGSRTKEEVKRNEKIAISQVLHSKESINPSPDTPIVKKRKSVANNGYRDTTIYSVDAKRFITIRAHDDDPSKSYGIVYDGKNKAYPVSMYDAPTEAQRLDSYNRELTASPKSQWQENKDAQARLEKSDQHYSAVQLSDQLHKLQSQDLSGVSVSQREDNGATWVTSRFHDGSVIGVKTYHDQNKEPRYVYIDHKGKVSKQGIIDSSNAKKIQQEITDKSFDSASYAQYQESTHEIQETLSSDKKYADFTISQNPEPITLNSRGDYQREVIISGKTGGIAFIQYSTQQNINKEKETLYDVMSTENIEDGGIFMKSSRSRSDYTGTELKRYLDALYAKDKANDKDSSLYDYL